MSIMPNRVSISCPRSHQRSERLSSLMKAIVFGCYTSFGLQAVGGFLQSRFLVYEGAVLLFAGVIAAAVTGLVSTRVSVGRSFSTACVWYYSAVFAALFGFCAVGMVRELGAAPFKVGYGTYFNDLAPFSYALIAPAFALLADKSLVRFIRIFVIICIPISVSILLGVDTQTVANLGSRDLALGEDIRYPYQVAMGQTLFLIFGGWALLTLSGKWWWKIAGASALCVVVATALIYSKRAPVATICLVLPWFAYTYVRRKRISEFVIASFILAVALLILIEFIGDRSISFNLYQALEQRFRAQTSVADLDRVFEATEMLAASEWYDFLFGHGLGSFQTFAGWAANTSVHIGWANLLFKGGIFLVLGTAMFLWRSMRNSFANILDRGSIFGLATVCISAEWLHSTAWGMSVSGIVLALALAGCLARTRTDNSL